MKTLRRFLLGSCLVLMSAAPVVETLSWVYHSVVSVSRIETGARQA